LGIIQNVRKKRGKNWENCGNRKTHGGHGQVLKKAKGLLVRGGGGDTLRSSKKKTIHEVGDRGRTNPFMKKFVAC